MNIKKCICCGKVTLNKKAFTLIELLAVIVILAIIAIIATPIILNIISDTKESANKRSIELYGKAVENAIGNYQVKYPHDTDITFAKIQEYIKYKGNKVECDPTKTKINKDGTVYLAGCKVEGDTKEYTYGKQVEPIVYPTYEIGEEIKLTGNTYTLTGTDDDGFTYTTENFSRWNVIKQTDTTVTLLSQLPLGEVYSSDTLHGFVNDRLGACSGCTFGDRGTYTYNGITSRIPTSDDLSEIITISGNNVSCKNCYGGFALDLYIGYSAGAGINILGYESVPMKIIIDGVEKRLFNGGPDLAISDARVTDTTGEYEYGEFVVDYLARQVIELPKSQIPDQSQF